LRRRPEQFLQLLRVEFGVAGGTENEVNANMIAADVRKSFIRASLSYRSLCRGLHASNRASYFAMLYREAQYLEGALAGSHV